MLRKADFSRGLSKHSSGACHFSRSFLDLLTLDATASLHHSFLLYPIVETGQFMKQGDFLGGGGLESKSKVPVASALLLVGGLVLLYALWESR